MIKPKALNNGDKVAIVSLSDGKLGEDFCQHYLDLGTKRLRSFGLEPVFMPNALKGIEYLMNHPEARAADLKQAFADDEIRGIIAAIGGEDTYRLLPYLLDDPTFCQLVQTKPKIFTGFSDSTVNHLMFFKLGMVSFYGPNYINDLSEMAGDMLAYTKEAFSQYFSPAPPQPIVSSAYWYEERTDFSASQIGTERVRHPEKHGFQMLQSNEPFRGRLLGGCLETLYETLTSASDPEQKALSEKYAIFPDLNTWRGKILFIETSEAQVSPDVFGKMLQTLKSRGIFDVIHGILVGKPQNEVGYGEYKQVLVEVIDNPTLPVLYNVNFGHAYPRCVLPYGVEVEVDPERLEIRFLEAMLD